MNIQKTKFITLYITSLACLLLFGWGDLFLGKHPWCVYYTWFGVPCPFCGLTRAVYEVMHLRICSSWNYHPLVLPMAGWFLLEMVPVRGKMDRWLVFMRNLLRFALPMLFITIWILRCFKYFPLP